MAVQGGRRRISPEPGERELWRGRADARLRLQPGDAVRLPFFAFWFGLVALIVVAVWPEPVGILGGVLMTVVGLANLTQPYRQVHREAQTTTYVVTDRRVVADAVDGRSWALDLDGLPFTQVTISGATTVIFGEPAPVLRGGFGSYGTAAWGSEVPRATATTTPWATPNHAPQRSGAFRAVVDGPALLAALEHAKHLRQTGGAAMPPSPSPPPPPPPSASRRLAAPPPAASTDPVGGHRSEAGVQSARQAVVDGLLARGEEALWVGGPASTRPRWPVIGVVAGLALLVGLWVAVAVSPDGRLAFDVTWVLLVMAALVGFWVRSRRVPNRTTYAITTQRVLIRGDDPSDARDLPLASLCATVQRRGDDDRVTLAFSYGGLVDAVANPSARVEAWFQDVPQGTVVLEAFERACRAHPI
ncbi:MAG: hypothetical protein KDA98_14290 [Acidimicrobiales bacterium]|nr:hypothetical protein [Acidimicrobiales bacterium]